MTVKIYEYRRMCISPLGIYIFSVNFDAFEDYVAKYVRRHFRI